MIEIVILLSVFIILAYTLKGVSGFGEGLVFTSLSLFFFDIKYILPVAATVMVVADFYLTFRLRKSIDRKTLSLMFFPILIGALLGVYAISVIESGMVKSILAVLIMIFSIKHLIPVNVSEAKVKMRKSLGISSGFSGGFLSALFGTGGPFIVMYLGHIGLRKAAFRATCVTTFVVHRLVRVAGYSQIGLTTPETVQIGLLLVPAMAMGCLLGMKIHSRVDENLFRKVVALLLFIIGFALLVK